MSTIHCAIEISDSCGLGFRASSSLTNNSSQISIVPKNVINVSFTVNNMKYFCIFRQLQCVYFAQKVELCKNNDEIDSRYLHYYVPDNFAKTKKVICGMNAILRN